MVFNSLGKVKALTGAFNSLRKVKALTGAFNSLIKEYLLSVLRRKGVYPQIKNSGHDLKVPHRYIKQFSCRIMTGLIYPSAVSPLVNLSLV